MKELKHVTDEILSGLIAANLSIDSAETYLTAHSYQFLERLMAEYPREYVRQLNEYPESEDPIQTAHSDIMSRLNYPPFDKLVEKVGRIAVRNIRGGTSKVAVWKRRKN